MSKSKLEKIVIIIFSIIVMFISFKENSKNENIVNELENSKISYEIDGIPEYSGETYVLINNNIPKFSLEDLNIEEDYYSNLKDEKVRNGND